MTSAYVDTIPHPYVFKMNGWYFTLWVTNKTYILKSKFRNTSYFQKNQSVSQKVCVDITLQSC